MLRKKGISLILPTQNVEDVISLCVESFADFGDEIIIVDNGSKDNTREIIHQLVKEYDHIVFFDKPELIDLYQNRQFAFKQSKYEWIARLDSDYVAYTSGNRNIKKLRNLILHSKKTFPPKAFGITQVDLFPDIFHYRNQNKSSSPISTLPARIIQWFPGMKFKRLGRWEGIRWQKYLNHIQLDEVFWFHLNFKSKINQLIRMERNNWRELGDFKKYPTREIYIRDVIEQKFNTTDFSVAAEKHWDLYVKPFIRKYDENEFLEYPEIIKKSSLFH